VSVVVPAAHVPAFLCPEMVFDPVGGVGAQDRGFTADEVADLREQLGDI
jgi:hypothetical protein